MPQARRSQKHQDGQRSSKEMTERETNHMTLHDNELYQIAGRLAGYLS
jgi:hypothetical protein